MNSTENFSVHYMHYPVLEDTVKGAYGREYDVLDALGDTVQNDTYQLYRYVDGTRFMYVDSQEVFDAWLRGENTSDNIPVFDMLGMLVRDGHLPAGNYLIEVMW